MYKNPCLDIELIFEYKYIYFQIYFYMYQKVPVEDLSEHQMSRLRNGHGVRVKHHPHGRHHIMMSKEQVKKVGRAHQKGAGVTLTLDPYQMNHHAHHGHGIGKMIKKAFKNPVVKNIAKQIGHMGLAAAGAYGQANGYISPEQAHLLESVGHNAIESKSANVKNILKNEALHMAESHGFDPNAPAQDYSNFYNVADETSGMMGHGIHRKRHVGRPKAHRGGAIKINHKALNTMKNIGKQMLHGAVTYGLGSAGEMLGGPLGGIGGVVASNYANNALTKAGAGVKRRRKAPVRRHRRGGALMPAGY